MKKIFSLMIATVAMFTMNAQTFESSRFIDNTYLRVEGGATALTKYKYNEYTKWGHAVQGVIGAEVGKWVTPKFGVAFEGDFGIRNGRDEGKFNYNTSNAKTKAFNYITVTGLAKFNVSNILAGWNPDREFEFVLATGPMWIHGYPAMGSKSDFGVKFKAEVNYNINRRFQLNLIPEFNYNLTGADESAGEHPKFDVRNSWYALKVGVTYKMGKQFTECPYKYTQADVDALNAEINELRARQPRVVEKIVEKVIIKEVSAKNDIKEANVLFDFDSAQLSNEAKTMLDNITGEVEVIGSASPEGTKSHNAQLAAKRAEAVANYLKARNVKVKNVTADLNIGSRAATVK